MTTPDGFWTKGAKVLLWIGGALLATAMISLGVFSGIKFAAGRAISPETITNNSYLDLGAQFPNYTLQAVGANNSISVAELAENSPVLLFLLAKDCPYCKRLMRAWKSNVVPFLREDIRLVVLFDQSQETDLEAVSFLIPTTALVYTTDRETQVEDDGLGGTPTVVGLAKGSAIRFIVQGFNREVDAEFINKNLSK